MADHDGRSVPRMTSTSTSAAPHSHEQRMDLAAVLPAATAALTRLSKAAADGLDPVVFELVKVRASQLNGCAFCIDMHARDARAAGVSQQRLDLLPAWREVPFYSEREQAALALAEAVTLLAHDGVSDAVWDAAAAVFDEAELAALLTGCIAINAWNRVGVPTRMSVAEVV
jgi:AhpD family alkylhydroperoxidase